MPSSVLLTVACIAITLVVGSLYLKETRATRIWDEVGENAGTS